jgi:hypothetical protein
VLAGAATPCPACEQQADDKTTVAKASSSLFITKSPRQKNGFCIQQHEVLHRARLLLKPWKEQQIVAMALIVAT